MYCYTSVLQQQSATFSLPDLSVHSFSSLFPPLQRLHRDRCSWTVTTSAPSTTRWCASSETCWGSSDCEGWSWSSPDCRWPSWPSPQPQVEHLESRIKGDTGSLDPVWWKSDGSLVHQGGLWCSDFSLHCTTGQLQQHTQSRSKKTINEI